jgi:hypothetical protein
MDKKLSERIAARTVKKKNRAIFLALRSDIKQALVDGWSIKSIWETLHEEGKIDFGYSAFLGYTNRLILSQSNPISKTPEQKLNVKTVKAGQTPEPKKTGIPTMGGFTFNPIPNKEELF